MDGDEMFGMTTLKSDRDGMDAGGAESPPNGEDGHKPGDGSPAPDCTAWAANVANNAARG